MKMRGSAEFVTTKGFLDDFAYKGGHEAETLPDGYTEDGFDVDAQIDEGPKGKKAANVKGNENTASDSATTTMEDNVDEVAEGAERDIADGYVQDTMKGYEAFNAACDQGIVVKEYGLNKANVGDVIDTIVSEVETKGVGDVARSICRKVADKADKVWGKRFAARKLGDKQGKVEGAAERIQNYAALNPGTVGAGILGAGALGVGGAGAAGYKLATDKGLGDEVESLLVSKGYSDDMVTKDARDIYKQEVAAGKAHGTVIGETGKSGKTGVPSVAPRTATDKKGTVTSGELAAADKAKKEATEAAKKAAGNTAPAAKDGAMRRGWNATKNAMWKNRSTLGKVGTIGGTVAGAGALGAGGYYAAKKGYEDEESDD
jgi:hypothetical protein